MHWSSDLLNELPKRGLIPEAAALRFLQAFHGDPSCEPLPRLRETANTLNLTFDWRNTWHHELFGFVLLNEMHSITIDGQPADWSHSSGWSWNRDNYYGTVQLPELAPGKHTLKCEIDSALVADKDMVGLADEAPSQDWPPAKKRWTRSFQAELKVYSKDAQIVSLTQDPALDPVSSGALSVKQVVVRRKGDGASAVVLFNIGDKLPVPISFDVTLCVGGQTANCGNFWSAKGTPGHSNSQGGTELKADIDLLDPQVKEAEIILTPNPGPVEPLAGVERIWGKEVKFSHVPLTRYDIR